MEASATTTVGDGRSLLERSPLGGLPDRVLKWGLTVLAGAILLVIGYFFIRLIGRSTDAFRHMGVFGFIFRNDWDVSHNVFGAWPLVFGTILTSAIALVIGVPVAVAAAVYVTELCPARARKPLSLLVDLLAAVPSVVYGLWGVFVLIPKLKPAMQWFADTFHFLPFVAGHVAGPSYFVAGLILAIMILPIVSAISREVISTVPSEHKEAALALGATRWEMIRIAVLPYSRTGITGASMLGLGRAIGETIAVVLVVGASPNLGHSIFQQGYSLAAAPANEFGESTGLHTSALFAAGLVLFLLTLVVNIIARAFIVRGARNKRLGAEVLAPAAEAEGAPA